jgi:hypothetical protein
MLRHGEGATPLFFRKGIALMLLLAFTAYATLEVLIQPLLEIGSLPVKEHVLAFVPGDLEERFASVIIVGDRVRCSLIG